MSTIGLCSLETRDSSLTTGTQGDRTRRRFRLLRFPRSCRSRRNTFRPPRRCIGRAHVRTVFFLRQPYRSLSFPDCAAPSAYAWFNRRRRSGGLRVAEFGGREPMNSGQIVWERTTPCGRLAGLAPTCSKRSARSTHRKVNSDTRGTPDSEAQSAAHILPIRRRLGPLIDAVHLGPQCHPGNHQNQHP